MNPDRGGPLAVGVAVAAAVLLICVALLVLRHPGGLDDEPGIAMTPGATAPTARSVGPLMTPNPDDGSDDVDDDAPQVVQQAPPQTVAPQNNSGGTTSRDTDSDDDSDTDSDKDSDDDDDGDDD